MLMVQDATADTDLRIEHLVSTCLHRAPSAEVPPYSREKSASRDLQAVMEQGNRKSELKLVSVDEEPYFVYTCTEGASRPFAQGIGRTPELAICDAFLHCAPNFPGTSASPSPQA